jgi:hypothetical protein
MSEQELEKRVNSALNEIKERMLHPEKYNRLGQRVLLKSQQERNALEPRYRLSSRLVMLLAVKKWEAALLKETKEDADSIAAAKTEPLTGLGDAQLQR